VSLTDEHLVLLRDGIETSKAVSMGERWGGCIREREREERERERERERRRDFRNPNPIGV
jgi:hypothetical protein